MSRRSDVSKMLVSHHGGRAASAVGQRRIQRVSDSGSSISVAKIGMGAVKKPPPTASGSCISTNSSVAVTASATPSSNKNYGFLQMKCLEVLKKAGTPLHVQEMQVILGHEYMVAGDRDFLRILAANPRVRFDAATKLWSFKSPYQWFTGPESLLAYLRTHRQFEISSEALEYHADVANWVNDLLSKHAVRAIRGTKTSRCKVFSAESSLYCNLYNPNDRCDGCKGLQGIVLYFLGPDYLENVEIDPDIKELWHRIPPTPAASVVTLMGAHKRPSVQAQNQGRIKRRKPASSRAPRLHKIANVHIYSAEELKEVLASEMAHEPANIN